MSASGFEFRPRPRRGRVDQFRLPCEKIFSTAEERNGGESSSPSAPFSRSSPLASNFNYTLPIGRTDRGEGQRGRASKRGLERREWLDARPTYQDNGFHIGADAPYIPIRSKGLRLISIASRYPSPGWKASASAHTTHARIYARRGYTADGMFDRYFYVATSAATLSRVSARSRRNEPVFLSSPFRCLHVNLSSDRTFSSAFSTQTCNFIEVRCESFLSRSRFSELQCYFERFSRYRSSDFFRRGFQQRESY